MTFDALFSAFETDREVLLSHSRASIRAMVLAKAAAYRMAKTYSMMEQEDHRRLFELARTRFPKSSAPITSWLEESFAPLCALGEDHFDLLKAVAGGMSLAEYKRTPPALYLHRLKESRRAASAELVPPPPSTPPDSADDIEWKPLALALQRRLAESERKCMAMGREIALLKRAHQKLTKIVIGASKQVS